MAEIKIENPKDVNTFQLYEEIKAAGITCRYRHTRLPKHSLEFFEITDAEGAKIRGLYADHVPDPSIQAPEQPGRDLKAEFKAAATVEEKIGLLAEKVGF